MSSDPFTMKGLGYHRVADRRDEEYPFQLVIPNTLPDDPFRYYVGSEILDQGSTPQCVGFTWRQWLSSSLKMHKSGPDAETIYREAQLRDEWSGTNYDGTSIRGAAKYLREVGVIDNYVWAWDADSARRWMLHDKGTICLGIPWYSSMFYPKSNGHVDISGSQVGGHAVIIIGYNENDGRFRLINSWGRDWGQNGRFWLTGEQLDQLVSDYGELCAAVHKEDFEW